MPTLEQLRQICDLEGKPLRGRILLTDRSRIVSREECPTQRYYGYECETQPGGPDGPGLISPSLGIQPVRKSVPLCTGSAVHEGLAWLMKLAKASRLGDDEAPIANRFTPHCLDTAVKVSLDAYKDELSDSGFLQGVGPKSGTNQWIIQEQSALTEGLVRVGGLRVLPQLLETGHIILSVEKERITYLGEDESTDTTLFYLSRADLEMYDPHNQLLYVINYKTKKTWDDRDADRLYTSMQTVGEPAALQRALELGQLNEELAVIPNADPDCIRTAGVQYIVFLKGIEKYDESRGHEVTYNHLTRAWLTVDPLKGKPIYAWRYFHEGSRKQVLSKGSGFHPFESFPGGTRGWLEALNNQEVEPRYTDQESPDPLGDVIAMPAMIQLRPDRVNRWRIQTTLDELRWRDDLESGRPISQHTHSCGSGKWRCSFWRICWEDYTPDSSEYQPRNPNHPELED